MPETQRDLSIPPATIAQDTISQSINTQTKSILGQYSFESLGAIKIASLLNLLANIAISPNGIIATNANGVITFTLDGTTGDATFLGTLKAGTLIAGDSNVIIGTGGSGGGRILLYNSGIPQILIGDSS